MYHKGLLALAQLIQSSEILYNFEVVGVEEDPLLFVSTLTNWLRLNTRRIPVFSLRIYVIRHHP